MRAACRPGPTNSSLSDTMYRLGMTGNFNYVLREATSPFFMWAAQDDLRAPTFLEETLALLRASPSRGWLRNRRTADRPVGARPRDHRSACGPHRREPGREGAVSEGRRLVRALWALPSRYVSAGSCRWPPGRVQQRLRFRVSASSTQAVRDYRATAAELAEGRIRAEAWPGRRDVLGEGSHVRRPSLLAEVGRRVSVPSVVYQRGTNLIEGEDPAARPRCSRLPPCDEKPRGGEKPLAS